MRKLTNNQISISNLLTHNCSPSPNQHNPMEIVTAQTILRFYLWQGIKKTSKCNKRKQATTWLEFWLQFNYFKLSHEQATETWPMMLVNSGKYFTRTHLRKLILNFFSYSSYHQKLVLVKKFKNTNFINIFKSFPILFSSVPTHYSIISDFSLIQSLARPRLIAEQS